MREPVGDKNTITNVALKRAVCVDLEEDRGKL
jgi:hypothetical protein